MFTSARILSALTVTAGMLLFNCGAGAETVEICAAPLNVQTLDARQFDQLRGRYAMADGSVLNIRGTRRHPVAVVGDSAPIMLRAVANATLISEDGSVRIEFRMGRDGDAESLTLSRSRI